VPFHCREAAAVSLGFPKQNLTPKQENEGSSSVLPCHPCRHASLSMAGGRPGSGRFRRQKVNKKEFAARRQAIYWITLVGLAIVLRLAGKFATS
jgi:hypothetical protein